ncbi:MAG TPA: hypothetical protein VGX78_02085 [Pirellulales bacterium]|jgi:hypothetical protein|nr:hypothetical protein [Pirellulales bacterium]
MNVDLTSGIGRMGDAMKTIHMRWDETKEVWTDQRSEDFEATYMEPLDPQVRVTIDKLRRLAQVFTQACQECT